ALPIYAPVAGSVGELHRVERLRERAVLVHLYQYGIGDTLGDASRDALGVGDEQVVSDELQPTAEFGRERLPASPVLFGEWVFDRDDRVRLDEPAVVRDHLVGRLDRPFEAVALAPL